MVRCLKFQGSSKIKNCILKWMTWNIETNKKKSLNDQTLKIYAYIAKHGNYLRSAEITLPFKFLIHSLICQIRDRWGQDVWSSSPNFWDFRSASISLLNFCSHFCVPHWPWPLFLLILKYLLHFIFMCIQFY